ncbi:hypothetical protein K435DRAFT_809605 [Dendrothele bispora CBS 962.96]|uniref:Uncharacterized protein n=1 Tax=Dendrothele bispora (strain CBS 962.96) TaxID=1314807 RepID=A0A4S8KXR4_DENBC|nr:hypothetical protein K435DRAFT_809605 [Dendrothele bispora CBS 962.96]
MAFKQTPHLIASRLEGYCISGVEGITRNYVQETIQMKKNLVQLIQDKLNAAAGKTKVPRMYYKNFDQHIMAKYGIKIVNWPLEKFRCPSKIPTRVEVQLLMSAWESGTTYFHKMTSAEWKDWGEKRFEEALKGAEGIQTTEPGSEGQESATTPQCEKDPTLMPSPRASNNPLTVPEVHNQAPTVPPAQTAIVPIDTGAIPPPAQQPPVQQAPPAPNKRGRKRKALADTNQAFVNSTAVTGTNGKIAMQTTKRRKRWDSGLSKEEAQRVRNERKENKQTAARG